MLVRCPVDLSKLKRVIGQIVVVQAEVKINEDISFCKISRCKKIINVQENRRGNQDKQTALAGHKAQSGDEQSKHTTHS